MITNRVCYVVFALLSMIVVTINASASPTITNSNFLQMRSKLKSTSQELTSTSTTTTSTTMLNGLRPTGSGCSDENKEKLQVCSQMLLGIADKKFYQFTSSTCERTFGSDKNSSKRKMCDELYEKVYKKNEGAMKKAMKEKLWPRLLCYHFMGGEQNFGSDCLRTNPTGMTCLFFHGSGRGEPEHDAALGKAVNYLYAYSYYKLVDEELYNICEPVFYYSETNSRGWSDQGIEKEWCGAIDYLKPAAVFSHSMGNLILAAGAANGYAGCSTLGTKDSDTHWYLIQGPLAGSPVAPFAEQQCKKTTSFIASLWLFFDKKCNKDKTLSQQAYYSLFPDYVNPQSAINNRPIPQLRCPPKADDKRDCVTLKDIAKQRSSADLCGFSPAFTRADRSFFETWFSSSGLAGKVLTEAAEQIGPNWGNGDDKVDPPKTGNDGLVPVASCKIGEKYESVPTAKHYAFNGNHLSGRCSHKDDDKDQSQQSCAWIKYWASESRRKKKISKSGESVKVPESDDRHSPLDNTFWATK